ncbi:MAG: hypothetical protein ACTHJ0_16760 [Flavipsychrobacter sp.]
MDKLLLVMDAMKPDVEVVNFGCYIAGLTSSRLTGVFLENLDFEEVPAAKLVNGKPYLGTVKSTAITANEERRIKCNENIEQFKKICTDNNVHCNVHRDRNVPQEELKQESRFADALIIDAETTFTKKDTSVPTQFIDTILDEAKCPVIIAGKEAGINNLLFLYDGSDASLQSARQFAYLFPELREINLAVLYVNLDNAHITAKKKLRELLTAHFDNIDFISREGNEFHIVTDELSKRDNPLLITDTTHKWIADRLLAKINRKELKSIPIFITNQVNAHL